MNPSFTEELTKAGVSLLRNANNPRPAARPNMETSSKFHKDAWAEGVTLNDYTDREPSADGTYVKVTTHRERIELIEQPPTPAEIAEQKDQRKHSIIFGAVVASGLLGIAGILQVLDRKQVRGQVAVNAKTTNRPSGS